MISYLQAARELDLRWSFSLQFLPTTPALRGKEDSDCARLLASAELDMFMRYAREISALNGLNLAVLVDLYDLMLINAVSGFDRIEDILRAHRAHAARVNGVPGRQPQAVCRDASGNSSWRSH